MNSIPEEETLLGPTLKELVGLVEQTSRQDGIKTLFRFVRVFRSSTTTLPTYSVYEHLLCVIVQGSKNVVLGDDCYVYDTTRCLVNTAALPVAFQITDASVDRPYLSILIDLDPAMIRSVIVEAGLSEPDTRRPLRAIDALQVDRPLLDAILRLARLFHTPRDAHYLAPLVLREIVYRLLIGEQGTRLHQSAMLGGQTHQVVRAITWMRNNFDKPLRIETLARECGMSSSGLHHHFKSVTTMSPLQFQKQLRLQEARRLMIGEGFDAAGAGFKVGYEDAAYFNRDYKRFFGTPPYKDALRLRSQVS